MATHARGRAARLARALRFAGPAATLAAFALGATTIDGLAAGAPPPQGTLDADEEVVLFPGCGRSVDGGWDLELHGWVFERERRAELLTALVARLGLDADDLGETSVATAPASRPAVPVAEARTILRERAAWFLVDNERGEFVPLQVAGRIVLAGPSDPDGHFRAVVRLPTEDGTAAAGAPAGCAAAWVTCRVAWPEGPAASRPATAGDLDEAAIALIEAEGLSVISDIDDTLRISEVTDKRALLARTFVREFEAVPGMASLLAGWAQAGARFHYVSASPWQLYPPLARFFRAAGFPPGVFHLKDFRWRDETFLNLFQSPEEYKTPLLTDLLARFPHRRFVLLGDSGERDPEIYGAVARRHRGQIVRIFIRAVEPGDDSARYRRAFDGLPHGLWQVFHDPAELPPLADASRL